jgi:hypothetical protein
MASRPLRSRLIIWMVAIAVLLIGADGCGYLWVRSHEVLALNVTVVRTDHRLVFETLRLTYPFALVDHLVTGRKVVIMLMDGSGSEMTNWD